MAPYKEAPEETMGIESQTKQEAVSPIDEVLFGPMFDNGEFGRLILTGLWNDNIFEENIAHATGNTGIRFVTRQEFEQQAETDKYILPEDITPKEFMEFIRKVYESSQAYTDVEEILATRLHSTNQHLQQIKRLANERLNPTEHENILNNIGIIADGMNKFVNSLDFEVETYDETSETSLIGLTTEEVENRLDRLIELAKTPRGEKVVDKYLRLVVNTAGNGLKTEVQERLKGEAGVALYTKGISYMVDSMPVAGFFKEKKELENHTGIVRAMKQLQKRLIGLVSSANENEKTLRESLQHEVEILQRYRGTESEPEAQEMFLNALLRKVTEYDGWASNLEYTTRETAPTYVTEFGELCCIGRCALEYGMLRDAGFKEEDLFSADVEGHSTLIVRLSSGELKMLENSGYIDDEDPTLTHPYYRVYSLEGMDAIRGVSAKHQMSLSTQTIRTSNDGEMAGFKRRYGDRQTTIYPGARGLGLMYLNQLGRMMRVRDLDASNEIFGYVLSIAPDNMNAIRGQEKNLRQQERRPKERFKKVLAETN